MTKIQIIIFSLVLEKKIHLAYKKHCEYIILLYWEESQIKSKEEIVVELTTEICAKILSAILGILGKSFF